MPANERRLRDLRMQLQRQLADRLHDAATPLVELRELQERLRLVDAALQRRGHWRSFLLAALAVLVILSSAWLIPVPRVPFTLEATAGQVRLHMPQAGLLATPSIQGEWLLDGYRRLESPDRQLAVRAASGPLVARGALRLQGLHYPADTTLLVAAAGRQLRIGAEAGSGTMAVLLQMNGPVEWDAVGEEARWREPYPWGEWMRLRFEGQEGSPPPVELVVDRDVDITPSWSTLKPTAVDFTARQYSAGSEPQWTSSLRSARLVLPATRTEITLQSGDGIELRGLELQRSELSAAGDAVLRLSGTASTIDSQVGTYRRSLKPSVLEWIARNHTLGLLWTAAVFLWGVSAWLRRQWDSAT